MRVNKKPIVINNKVYTIEHEFNNLWYVFKKHQNCKFEVYHAKTWTKCNDYLKEVTNNART